MSSKRGTFSLELKPLWNHLQDWELVNNFEFINLIHILLLLPSKYLMGLCTMEKYYLVKQRYRKLHFWEFYLIKQTKEKQKETL